MIIDRFFFRLYSKRKEGKPLFAGTTFPVTPNGGFLTCRHVADVGSAELLIQDNITKNLIPVSERLFPTESAVDLAFVRASLPPGNHSFLPLLTPRALIVGESVYSYGFFSIGRPASEIEQGYFAGHIVNFTKSESHPAYWNLTLPYPVIEGMSGSPVLTYHNGPKLVGLAYGNRSTRILASEVQEYAEGAVQSKESIHRIVEFGLAHHVATLSSFLTNIQATGFVTSSERVQIADLE